MLFASQTPNIYIEATCRNLYLMTEDEFRPIADLIREGRDAMVTGTLSNEDVMRVIWAFTDADSSRLVTYSTKYNFYGEIKIGGDAPTINMAQLVYVEKLSDIKRSDMIIVTMKPGHFAFFEILN